MYDEADARSTGSTFSISSKDDVRNVYSNVNATPQINDTVRAGEAASLAAPTLPVVPSEPEVFEAFAYARDASPVVALLRKENRYNAWSIHNVAGDSAANPAFPTVLPTNELSMFDRRGFIR
jgi:hypothetical protein